MLTLFTFTFAKRRIRPANASQDVSNINHFASVSDSLGRLYYKLLAVRVQHMGHESRNQRLDDQEVWCFPERKTDRRSRTGVEVTGDAMRHYRLRWHGHVEHGYMFF